MANEIKPTVAIIGGGLSGLASCKSALECGMDPTVLEKGSMIGGGWSREGFTPEGMQTNISRYTCMFSDFEWKEGTPDFPTQKEFEEYLFNYATTFKIHPHVYLNSNVTKIFQSHLKKWKVEWVNNGFSVTKDFDYVIVCTGIFSKAAIPNIPGINSFKGHICHSKEFKKPDIFQNKSVVVIGNAFSGCEIAANIAEKTDRVIHAYKRAIWVIPRCLSSSSTNKSIPGDLLFYSRAANKNSASSTTEQMNIKKNTWFKSVSKQGSVSEALTITGSLSIPPFVAISDTYLEQIGNKRIQLKQGVIEKIEGDKIYFQDLSWVATEAIVFCTGYRTSLPFFDNDILKTLGYQEEDQFQPLLLHKTVFPPPSLPNLAFVGLYRGPFVGAVELQSRWVCMAFSQKISLPSSEEITNGIQEELNIRKMSPRPQFPHGNYVGFCEDLAKQIGVLPDLEKIKFENQDLFDKLWTGPFTTASYRLSGLGSNPKLAMKIIDDVNDAMRK